MKFHHNQKVNIIKGYYKTHKGVIKAYNPETVNTKTGMREEAFYVMVCNIDNKDTEIKVHEDEIKQSWF